jgi:putative tricarboxylic transport membrane protein
MAVFLGLLVLHGMQPGPMMLLQHETEIFGLILALTAASILASVIGLLMIRPLAAITLIDGRIMVPMVVIISLVGAYATNTNPGDIVITLGFGLLGYLMVRLDYPRLTLVIALVLGELAERSFHQSMMISRGDWSIFVGRTVAAILVALIVLSLAFPVAKALWQRRRAALGPAS